MEGSTKEEADRVHLGCGLYAIFDGYQIELRAPHPGGSDIVYLDRTTFEVLKSFARVCWKEK